MELRKLSDRAALEGAGLLVQWVRSYLSDGCRAARAGAECRNILWRWAAAFILGIAFVGSLLILGCASGGQHTLDNHSGSVLSEGSTGVGSFEAVKTARLRQNLGLFEHPESEVYRQRLLNQLNGSLPHRAGCKDAPYKLLLADSPKPLALSIGNYEIILSTGLLFRLRSEGELAFVIAHEMGHYCLGHLERLRSRYLDSSGELTEQGAEVSREMELESDQFGVQVMIDAGFNLNDALLGLASAYGQAVGQAVVPNYPGVAIRVALISEQFNLPQPVLGVVPGSREFTRFIRELREFINSLN